jgi:two-component system response regulator YesN
MAYKVVIVDDEPMIGRWLSEKVDWQAWDCEVVGVGENGVEGKQLVETLEPDLLISDVQMPGLNGLELAEYVRKNHPKTLVLILSGYNEFDFVRTAMRNQVFDYLLKPIDTAEFHVTMDKVFAHMEQLTEGEKHNAMSQKKLEETDRIAEDRILMSLMMNGNQELESLLVNIRRWGLDISKGQIAVYELQQIPQKDNWKPVYQYAVKNILQETFERLHCRTQVMFIHNRCVVVSLFTSDLPASLWEKRALEVASDGLDNVKFYLKSRISLGIGRIFHRIEDLHSSYRTAVQSLESQVFWANENVPFPFPLTGSSTASIPPESSFELDKTLFESIESGNLEATSAAMNVLTLRLNRTGSIEFVHSACTEILIHLSNIAEKWGKDREILPLADKIRQYPRFDDLMLAVKENVCSLCIWIKDKKKLASASLPDQVALYIQEHYSDPNIQFSGIAEKFQISMSHLSRIFVKATGMNFNEYLTQVRLKQAKYLMEHEYQLSNQEIAERIGFSESRYFSQVFKRYNGKTPNEYRGKKTAH